MFSLVKNTICKKKALFERKKKSREIAEDELILICIEIKNRKIYIEEQETFVRPKVY